MELRQLRYFLSAVKHLSFTDAAEECCIVQSAMSQQIRALEKELGVALFERTKRGLRLTREGEFAALEARRLLEKADAMRITVRQAGLQGGTLRVGCQCNLLHDRLSRALAALRHEAPDLRAYVKTGLRQSLLTELRDGKLDCVIALYERSLAEADEMETQAIAFEDVLAMLPANSDLTSQKTIPIDELLRGRLILYASEFHNDALNDVLSGGGADAERLYVESQSDIETLVSAGYGISFCVGSAQRANAGIAYRGISGVTRLQSCLVFRQDSPKIERVRRFASYLLMDASEINVL